MKRGCKCISSDFTDPSLCLCLDPKRPAQRTPVDAEEIWAPQRHLHSHSFGVAPKSRGNVDATRWPLRDHPRPTINQQHPQWNHKPTEGQHKTPQNKTEQPSATQKWSQLHLTQKMSKATHLSQVRLCETSGARSLLIPTPSPGSCLRCWDVLHDHSNPPYTELQTRNCHNLLFFWFFFVLFCFSLPLSAQLVFWGAVLPPSGHFSQVFCSVVCECVWAVFFSSLLYRRQVLVQIIRAPTVTSMEAIYSEVRLCQFFLYI